MALDFVKELKDEIKALKDELAEVKGLGKEYEEKLADMERKSIFTGSGNIDKDLDKAAKLAVKAKLKAAILGKSVKDFGEYEQIVSLTSKAIKPADIDNWIAEKFSKDIVELLELELKVEKLFSRVEVPKGFGKLSLPRKTARTSAYLIQPAEDAVASAIQGDKVSFDPVKIKTLVELSDEADNEAVVDTLYNVIREDIAYSLAKGIEEALVNGDKSGALNGNPAATDVTKAFDGIRKYADSNKVDGGGAVIDLTMIRAARKSLGAFGVNPSEIALLVNPNVFYQLLDIDNRNVRVIDNTGKTAGSTTGVVATVDGMPVVLTEQIPVDLDANGAKGGDLTEALLVNTKAFKVGYRNMVEAEKDRDIYKDIDIVVGRVYRDFQQVTIGTATAAIVNLKK